MRRDARLYPQVVFLALALAVSACGGNRGGKDQTEGETQPDPPADPVAPPPPPPPPPPANDDPAADPVVPQPILGEGEGLSSRQGHFLTKATWTAGPFAEDYSRIELVFADAARLLPTQVAVTEFDPQMPSMGHGTSTLDQVITAAADRPHVVTVDGIYFIMGGPWVIHVTATVNGLVDTVDVAVKVP